MMEENLNTIVETMKNGFNGLYTNQHLINEKINSLLTICSKNLEDIDKLKQAIQGVNYSLVKLDSLTNKLSDMEIQMQNSNGDHDSIVSAIQDITLHVDDLKRTLNQWKTYSDIY